LGLGCVSSSIAGKSVMVVLVAFGRIGVNDQWNQYSNGIMIAGLFAIFSKAFYKKGTGDGGADGALDKE